MSVTHVERSLNEATFVERIMNNSYFIEGDFLARTSTTHLIFSLYSDAFTRINLNTRNNANYINDRGCD